MRRCPVVGSSESYRWCQRSLMQENQIVRTKVLRQFAWMIACCLRTVALMLSLVLATSIANGADALPSWNDGKAKQSIVDFVAKVTKHGSTDFVPPPNASRHSTTMARSGPSSRCIFNFLCLDRVKAIAPQHPEWKDERAFRLAA